MASNTISTGVSIAGIPFKWNLIEGTCTFGGKPVTMMSVDSTLTGLMAGFQAMVGTERFALALQSEGRKSVDEDWKVIAEASRFEEGFEALATVAAAAGWGDWRLLCTDYEKKECIFQVKNSWESAYQKRLGVNWGCAMLAGKLAGYGSRLFTTNCWATQTTFTAAGDECDSFRVHPSTRTIEQEIEDLLYTDEATKADMAVALKKLQNEIRARSHAEQQLVKASGVLEERVREQTKKYRESERKYRNLVEGTSDLVARVDRRGRISYINTAAQELFSLTPADYVGISIFRFIHKDDRQRVKDWWKYCSKNRARQTSLELRQINYKTGQVYSLQWSAAFQYDEHGMMTGIGIIGRNVSEIRRIEQNYVNLFTKMLDGFALHEIVWEDNQPVDYRFLSINPAFETMTGLSADKVIGKTVREVIPDIEPHWIEVYGRVAGTGHPVTFESKWSAINKFFEITAYCPAPGQFACIFQDITYRRKNEEERVLLEEQLRRRHKMEAIGTLAGGIAHDFNNILAAIIGYTDIALEDLPDANPVRSQIREIRKAGNRAKELVKQILAFSRREERHQTPVDLNTMIQEVVVFLRATIPTTIDIELDLAPDCGHILADQTQIHQVLMNICTNASQAMEGHNGTLYISLREIELDKNSVQHLKGLPHGTYLYLQIGDTGSGIRKEHLDRIFDPYFTTKEFGKGSGMGLSVVHGIVKNHDGVIKVDSEPGSGTIVSLYFPQIGQKEEVPQPPAEILDERGTERLLVVDDDPSIATMLQALLQRLGYSALAQSSSRKALELFRADPRGFDMIITDQTMPEMTGKQLAQEVMQVRPDIPVILCTGYSSQIDEAEAARIGIKAFLMKPVSMRALAGTIRRVLDGTL